MSSILEQALSQNIILGTAAQEDRSASISREFFCMAVVYNVDCMKNPRCLIRCSGNMKLKVELIIKWSNRMNQRAVQR